jgi:hypothetical protein
MTLAAESWALAFGDLPVEDGFAMREAAETRFFRGRDERRFAGLLSVADLDAFLATDAATTSRISLADGSRQGSAAVPEDAYAFADGRANLPGLFALFDGGASLVVSQFDEMHAPLARFCRGLERAFLHPVQANIYLTPAGAQGFKVHYDTHDVLVLQVSGEKRWRIWSGRPVLHPTRNTPWTSEAAARPRGKPKLVLMKPGDALYVPRGVLHEAIAQQGVEPSLHVTVGLLEPSWSDALQAAVQVLEQEEPELRQAFPTWRLGEPEAAKRLAAAVAGRVAKLASPAGMERAAMQFLGRLADERPPMLGRGLTSQPPGARTRLRLSDAIHHHVVPRPGGADLRWAGGLEPLTEEQLGWLERLERGAAPRELGGADALRFCRRLAALGLLAADDAPSLRIAAE